jgi:uncharacterized membrane protein YhhN
MIDILILIAAAALLVGLLLFEKRESPRGILLTKPLLSALFIAVALAGPRQDPVYFGLVLAGLLACLAGDVFLIFTSSTNLFLAGVVSFLIGHILYAGAFFATSTPGMTAWIVGACGLAVSGAIFTWLRPHLGRMLVPIVAYMIVITVMVTGAASFMADDAAGFSAGACVFVGAILFYSSDIFVARQRFVADQYLNRLVGLPLYYAAQFLIAFSIRLH